MKSEIFRKSSLERVSSPEQLNDYIKVSNPSVWLVILALFILLISAGIWAFTGTMPTKVKLNGLFSDGKTVVCYLSTNQVTTQRDSSGKHIQGVKVGLDADVVIQQNNIHGKVKEVASVPVPVQNLVQSIGNEWVLNELQIPQSGYVFKVIIELDKNQGKAGEMGEVAIITEKSKPTDFLFS
ncbi:MAG: hypothetical protein LBJ95_02055 [Oscillospiraceae bacterium]|jgi:hypothetical protein|nr:hypothetical protein [Oscillospiraceae bacterium]